MATLIKERRVVHERAPSPEAGVIRLEPGDDPATVAHALAGATRVEVVFPKFGDGRGYSIAKLLRARYGYRGELREGEDPAEALAAFETFSVSYQRA